MLSEFAINCLRQVKELLIVIIRTLLSWLYNRCIRAWYIDYAIKKVLEYCYLRSSFLQSIISFRVWHENFVASEDEVSIHQLAASCGLIAEAKSVITDDGYVLSLHRLVPIEASDGNSSGNTLARKRTPVLLVHGLMQDCESFLCSGQRQSLASVLAHEGYDVWLGNNRGNRYSNLHIGVPLESDAYWNFCIDHLATFDIPAMVRSILSSSSSSSSSGSPSSSRADKVTIIGFSQGSAQTFLGLCNSQYLQEHINLFVALSPPIRLKGFTNTWLASLVTTYPWVLSLLFGTKAMFQRVLCVKNILTSYMFSRVVQHAMRFLFGWTCDNISARRRSALFQHVFSPSSVLCVGHWFQIMEQNELTNYRSPSVSTKSQSTAIGTATTAAISPSAEIFAVKRASTSGLFSFAVQTIMTVVMTIVRLFRSCACYFLELLVAYIKKIGSAYFNWTIWKHLLGICRAIFEFCRNVNIIIQSELSNPSAATITAASSGLLDTKLAADHDWSCPTNIGSDSNNSNDSDNDSNVLRVEGLYDISKVSCPIAVFAGDADGLIDTDNLTKQIPNCVYHHIEPSYEHLDIIWADNASQQIFPKIIQVLNQHDDLH